MNIVKPYVEVKDFDADEMLKWLEYWGRVCYKSEGKIVPGGAGNWVRNKIDQGHESLIEHMSITVRFVVDRGVTHEIVRHRLGSYSQESTRYCNYGKGDRGVTFIEPFFFIADCEEEGQLWDWKFACQSAETYYLELLERGALPQEARSVLSNSLKTELITTYNLREWRHFFRLRCSLKAHPQMQQVTIPLLLYLRHRLPDLFDDIPYNDKFPSEHYAEVRKMEYRPEDFNPLQD